MAAVPTLRWRKSSQSGPEADCVELANTWCVVRDTKNPDDELAVDFRGLLHAIQAGRFDV
jgi:hypothetical protein